jgi:hypothetical protein
MSKKFTYYGSIQNSLLPFLTGYWTANNIATDVYTNALGGAWAGAGGALYGTGINAQAFDFANNATIRYVAVPDNTLLSFTDGVSDLPFSIRMWVNFGSKSSTANFFMSKAAGVGLFEYYFYYLGGSNQFAFDKYSLGSNVNGASTLAPLATANNTWFHIVYTDNGTKFGGKIYVNGINQTGSNIETGTYVRMSNTTSQVVYGQASNQLANAALKHRGLIDEIAVFRNYELSAAQVLADYNGGIGKFYPNI